MKKQSPNNFPDGMELDAHASMQKPTSTRKTKNFRIITRQNNSFILTSVLGMEQRGTFPTNYLPIASNDVNGVCYILLAEVIDGEATGRGEIGTYPSPDYSGSTGSLTYTYRPLMNYAGDDGSFVNKDGPFRSIEFNFNLTNLPQIELQNDYDGTVNVIFAHRSNPMRIINSGFTVLPDNKYEIVDRGGVNDTNRYDRDNFKNLIQLVAKSQKILNVNLGNVTQGGRLTIGQYQYYFTYGTADGNETSLQGQTSIVPVFNGTKIVNINGGKNTDDPSDKLVNIILSNVDQAYNHINVYFTFANGMTSNVAIKSTYKISQRYTISGPTLEINHTGFEETIRIDSSVIQSEDVTIETAETITQADGYLLAGNITEKNRDIDPLRKFAKMIKLGHKEISMDIIGPEQTLTRMFNEEIDQTNIKSDTDAYNGAYANPKNVHDFLGHWGGEAYPYAIRFVYPDGTKSALFPCVGIDNVDNNNSGYIDSVSNAIINNLDGTGGFSTDGKMLNTNGVYRFPNRNAALTPKLLSNSTGGEGRISVNGITFKIPNFTVDLGDGKTIKDYAIGIQFFRGVRRPDVLIQGTLLDAIMIPTIDFDHDGTDEKLWNYNLSGGGYSEGNSKFVPAFSHILESQHAWASYTSGGTEVRSSSDKVRSGMEPFRFNLLNRDPHTVLPSYKSPFGMISTDAIVSPEDFLGVAGRDIGARILGKPTHVGMVRTPQAGETETTATHMSALVPRDFTISPNGTYPARAAYSPEELDVKNTLGFTSVSRFQCRISHFSNASYDLFRQKHNSYIGVRLDATIRASTPDPLTGDRDEGGSIEYAMFNKSYTASYIANLYSGSSQKNAVAVQQTYQSIDDIRYFPISNPMYFDDTIDGYDPDNTLSSRLDENRKILLFGGDCYISYTLRKLTNNLELTDPEFVDKNDIVRTGYTIGIFNEGNHNGAIRSTEVVNTAEGERQFPYNYAVQNGPMGNAYGQKNTWREYYLNESAGFNNGYNMQPDGITFLALPKDTPFVQSKWFTRVWASAQHIPNSFDNGYRKFFNRQYKDYPTKGGQIVKLVTNNNVVYCVQETSVGTIAIDERIETGQGNGGSIYLATNEILSPIAPISSEIGSHHKSSITATDNFVYGYSQQRRVLWYCEGQTMRRISDLHIRSFLDEQYGNLGNIQQKELQHNIISTWNKGYDEVLFTFYRNEEGGYNNDRTFTVQFSEITRKIHSFYTFIPVRYLNVGEKLFSVSVGAFNGIWLHDVMGQDNCKFYGVVHEPSIAVSVNPEIKIDKIFQNSELVGNTVLPYKMILRVDGAKSEVDVVYVKNRRAESNAKYIHGGVRITLPKVETVHNQDPEQKFDSFHAGNQAVVSVGSRLQGKYMIAEFYYNTPSVVELEGIYTLYKPLTNV